MYKKMLKRLNSDNLQAQSQVSDSTLLIKKEISVNVSCELLNNIIFIRELKKTKMATFGNVTRQRFNVKNNGCVRWTLRGIQCCNIARNIDKYEIPCP